MCLQAYHTFLLPGQKNLNRAQKIQNLTHRAGQTENCSDQALLLLFMNLTILAPEYSNT